MDSTGLQKLQTTQTKKRSSLKTESLKSKLTLVIQRSHFTQGLPPVPYHRILREELWVSYSFGSVNQSIGTRAVISWKKLCVVVFINQEKLFVAVLLTDVYRNCVFKIAVYLKLNVYTTEERAYVENQARRVRIKYYIRFK